MADPGAPAYPSEDGTAQPSEIEPSAHVRSIWPAIYPKLLELVQEHTSTIIFVNNRRAAERLAKRLNELANGEGEGELPATEHGGHEEAARARHADTGEPLEEVEIARAHHGSLSHEERTLVEEMLKSGRAALPGGDLLARARHRHGRRRPRHPGRVAEVGHPRPAADRPRRPRHRRDLERPDLPQIPRRPARVRGGRAADARRGDRGDDDPAEPARRARPAPRLDGGARRVEGRRRRAGRHRDPVLPRPLPRAARERPRHARRPLPLRPLRRAAPADRLGPPGGDDPRPQRLAPAGRHQRRHDPRPRPLRRPPARRPAGRRARRGDGLRGAPRPGLPARREQLADRGNHPRPGDRHARSRRPRRGAVLARRRDRPPGRARQGDRRLRPRGGLPRARRAGQGVRPRRTRRQQPRRLPARTAGRDPGRPLRPDDRGRALPRRDRRLAPLHPLPVRRPRPRRLGPRPGRENPQRARPRGRRDLVRRRHRHPPPRRRRAAARRPRAGRPARSSKT